MIRKFVFFYLVGISIATGGAYGETDSGSYRDIERYRERDYVPGPSEHNGTADGELGDADGRVSSALTNCTGVHVGPTDDLRRVMDSHPAGTTFCLSAVTYEVGGNTLVPENGDVLIGVPVTVGPLGEIRAPSKIHGTSAHGVLASPFNAAVLRLENLDISGSTTTCIHHWNAFTLTLRYSRVHDCAQTGLGAGTGSLIEHVEVDHNGSRAHTNITGGGIKTIHDITVRDSYIHNNVGNGMWWDCDVSGGMIENSRVTANSLSGIFVEISSGTGRGFIVRNNIAQGNNSANTRQHAGLRIVDSQRVAASGNIFGGNGRGNGFAAVKDARNIAGHNGCLSGFPVRDVTFHDNVMNGDVARNCRDAGVTCSNNQ